MRNRERDGLPGNKFSPSDKQVADELADVLTYLDLLAAALGVDLGRAAVEKFNEVSVRVGFPDRIELTPPSASDEGAIDPPAVGVAHPQRREGHREPRLADAFSRPHPDPRQQGHDARRVRRRHRHAERDRRKVADAAIRVAGARRHRRHGGAGRLRAQERVAMVLRRVRLRASRRDAAAVPTVQGRARLLRGS
jgi:hypothetical protein